MTKQTATRPHKENMTTTTELYHASLKLEGEIYKLSKIMDKETNLNKYAWLRSEIDKRKIQHAQYIEVLNEIEKMKTIKRKMRRGLIGA